MDTTLKSITNSYALFIDLNSVNSIKEAISFDSKMDFDEFIIKLKNFTSKYEVGIRQMDGTIETESFDDFKIRFFSNNKI